jgi:YVTN family beta-propeller protein
MKANLPRALGAALVPAIASLIATSAADAEPFAYVTEGDVGNQVAVIDTASNTVIKRVEVGQAPIGVAITPDGAFAYVANLFGVDLVEPHDVSVIDTATNTVIATVEVGDLPSGVAITPDGRFAYVTNSGSDNVSVIDTATNTVTATVPLGGTARGIAITPDGAFAYVSSGNVSVIDTASNTVTATVDVSGAFRGIAITPDGDFAYVSTGGNNVAVIDLADNTVTATVPLGGVVPLGGIVNGIAITPDGTFAYAATLDFGSRTEESVVAVIDTAANTVTAGVRLNGSANGVAITPDGAFAYVAIYYSGEFSPRVSVIDTASNTEVTTVAPLDAYNIAITPEPQAIEVRIDIQPGNKKNRINLRSNGNVAVAILSTGKFDATQVNWETVSFGPDEAPEIHQRSHIRDVDRDGDMDFVLHFKIRKTGIKCDDKRATITGETFSGQAFTGSDKIKTVKCD